jgi:hypothetical protein
MKNLYFPSNSKGETREKRILMRVMVDEGIPWMGKLAEQLIEVGATVRLYSF